MIDLNSLRYQASQLLSQPMVKIFIKMKFSPNTLSVMGFVGNLLACLFILKGFLLWGGILILFSGLFDLWDGALARVKGKTRFGAVLDSTLDRLSEALLFLALLFFFRELVWLIFLALVGSFLVSYIRARGEGVGIPCPTGFFTRAERIIILALGLILNQIFIALLIIAVLSWLTSLQRFIYLWQRTRE